jgi:hypothetical protein
MNTWKYNVDVRAIFHNDDFSVNEKAKLIAKNLRALPNHDSSLEVLLKKLELQTDADDFDKVWNKIYDWADRTRTLIKTF